MIKEYDGHKPKIHPSAFISKNSLLIGRVNIDSEASVWPGCVLRGDVEDIIVRQGSNIQDGVMVHTNYDMPVVVGKGVTVGHGAILHGCIIGDNCLIGMGAILLDGCVIGDNCIIAAGCLVREKEHIPPRSLVVGVPARIARPIAAEEIEKIMKSSAEYIEFSRKHKENDI
ncbi:MAG TPA: gamma carbonic anhydrase family protein [Elusimicrobia bacterium]|nr:MAG: gamma carbonic anhydrase family protein [Elusimicrobia bacterium RIFOXYA12_FULL_49_49]OGS05979.1 MAG: gamma carbonic anhydrase family protein [Elusimicrobia bacterium RIFOXYA1_FULL_47_7]OGS16178.1 MAG: gamma carbonic anhydrase family protein [Elusimicrobia bacterium RIFOXYA2_FULL_47_53]OGS26623.1 MAG: gamma carbonic anhydrase family protein [Elusimicrobia bacterium RIFOXYB12_FULL_50_12]OGS31332.1 MAG: gamma carbonic anhydrase family protein [Elusimicrobia bacterium RIFOXYB2_FULL_46_23]